MTRVVVVCMLDSIHSARWLAQFCESELEFGLVASRRHRRVHADIQNLLIAYPNNFKLLVHGKTNVRFEPYWDYFVFERFGKVFSHFSRSRFLKKKIEQNRPDFVHLLEIQNAGYLYLNSNPPKSRIFKVILTNWGSDIFYFSNFLEHRLKISNLLSQIDAYTAECRRDYHLASELGFSGENLPLIPNSGGFTSLDLSRELLHPRERKRIYLKGYGGLFGLVFEALIAVERILVEFPDYDLVITSVTSDAHKSVQNLWKRFPKRVRYFLLEDPQPHEVIMRHLAQSAVFVGASKSDGISTSFLEALVSGCYAIQTNTSCAGEWLDRGFIASVVATDTESIYLEIKKVINNEDLRTRAFDTNVALAREQLNYNTIAQIAQGFYKN